MKTTRHRKEDVKDRWRDRLAKEKGRDGERTPMQWNASANAGFTSAGVTPWLPIPPSSATVNVQAEEADPNSLLAWYKL